MKHALPLLFLFIISSTLAQPGEWTWMKGSNTAGAAAVFGTQGIGAPNNTPASLYESVGWTDQQGNFWLFGGLVNFGSETNTMWKYDVAANEWIWKKGSASNGASGVYGVQGIPSPTNMPGARAWGSVTWVDSSGNFWLYGGIGDDAYGGYQVLSDMWMFNPTTEEWTWIAGEDSGTVAVTYGTMGVSAPTNNPGNRAESNAAWVDNAGNLYLFGGAMYIPQTGGWSIAGFGNDMWKFDFSTMEWTWIKGTTQMSGPGVYGTLGVEAAGNYPPGRGSYSVWTDNNGYFWLFGGYNLGSAWNDLWRYNPATNNWAWMSGSNVGNGTQIASSSCTQATLNIPSNRYENRMSWKDGAGNFWLWGGVRNNFNELQNDLWHYNIATNAWTFINGSVTPNGAGSFGTQGVSSPTNVPPSKFGGMAWVDANCNFWEFGGSAGNWGAMNDLWRFVPDSTCVNTSVCPTQLPFPQSNLASSDTSICEKFCIDFFDQSLNAPTSWQWFFEGAAPDSSMQQNPQSVCYDSSGVYDVMLITTNQYGTDTLLLIDFVTVYPTPPTPVISQNGNVLTCSVSGVIYTWVFGSTVIPGATNQSITITQTGTYTVIIEDANGCTNFDNIIVEIIGINDVFHVEVISVYPNPSAGNITIDLSELISGKVNLAVFNALGQIVFSSERKIHSSHQKEILDLSELAGGVYFLEVNTENTIANKRIVLIK